MDPSVEIAKAIGDPVLILLYVVIVGLFGKIYLDSKIIRMLAAGFAKNGEALDNISKLLHAIITRGRNNVDI